MDDGAQQLQGVTQSLDESLQALEAAAQNFTQNNEGQTIDGYTDAQAQWSEGMREMHEALGSHTVALTNIHERYVMNDMRGASRLQR
jgi:uncharacterized protein YukE